MDEHGRSEVDEGSSDPGPARGLSSFFCHLAEFNREDRSVAVLNVATLESLVREAIEVCLHATGRPAKKLLGGDSSGGVLGFFDQCRLAYCLGIFGEQTLDDMEILVQVRNKFAHGGGGCNRFSEPAIVKLCRRLRTPDGDPLPQDKFDDADEINAALKTHDGDPKKLFCHTVVAFQYGLTNERRWKQQKGRATGPFYLK